MSLSFARRGANAPASAPTLALDRKTKKKKDGQGPKHETEAVEARRQVLDISIEPRQ